MRLIAVLFSYDNDSGDKSIDSYPLSSDLREIKFYRS